MDVNELVVFVGETIAEVTGLEEQSGEVLFTFVSGKRVKMHHQQDCCEQVYLADFDGDAGDLVGGVVIKAEERCEYDHEGLAGSSTWTFYDIQTTRGSLWMRWVGESNGYYSESVDIEVIA